MNYLKTDTVGVDSTIKKIQTKLYNGLVSKWSASSLDAYGRVYKNIRNKIVIPEYYIDDKEYKEILLDDTKDGIIFFNVGDIHNVKGDVLSVDCEIIFSLNLKHINGNTTRTDAEVQKDAFNLLNKSTGIFTLNQVQTGLVNVYSDFRGVAALFLDMQEFHHFKISGTLNYTNNC